MQELVTAIGLLLVIEGLLYAVAPSAMRTMLQMVMEMAPETLRNAGLASVAAGLLVVWFARVLLGG